MPPTSDAGFFQIELRARDADDYPALPDINYFLHDLNLLYEFSRVIVDSKYRDYRFSRFFAYRNRRRIDPVDQLRVERLRQQSPLSIVAIVVAAPSAAATIWVVVQALEKIANFALNRDILRLTREKLRIELAKARISEREVPEMPYVRFVEQVRIREATYTYEKIETHLRENPVHVFEIEITYVRELPRKIQEEK
jgi:hypothetical protein